MSYSFWKDAPKAVNWKVPIGEKTLNMPLNMARV